MKRFYRIVRDSWSGYEVQHCYWCWPFWVQTSSTLTDSTNTHSSVEDAEAFARRDAKSSGAVVKMLGYFNPEKREWYH